MDRTVLALLRLVARQDEDHDDHDHDHDAEEQADTDASGHSHGFDEALGCDAANRDDIHLKLRVAAIFIILATSTLGALFPIWARRRTKIPRQVYDFAKYFGSGVIIATAFIHLLVPGFEQLASPCLGEGWHSYPWAPAISMMAVFFLFFAELSAFRWGMARMAKAQTKYDTHGHDQGYSGTHAAHGPEGGDLEANPVAPARPEKRADSQDSVETNDQVDSHNHHHGLDRSSYSPISQIISVVILEFGVVFHSIIIGLTLAVDEEFKILLIVVVFHQMFEGLGLGTRLSALKLPDAYKFTPYLGAIAYGLTTPIGIAIGLGIRRTYNPGSATASAVAGVFDSFSSGILLYTGLVELLAHEFLFNKEMQNAPLGKVAYAGGCVLLGAAVMSLLGKWA